MNNFLCVYLAAAIVLLEFSPSIIIALLWERATKKGK